MKRFLWTILISMILAFSAFSAEAANDRIYVLTMELYNDNDATGGTTTVESGASVMTWTAKGNKATNLDNRTIDLNDYLGADTKVFATQLGATYAEDDLTGGVLAAHGTTGESGASVITINLAFSQMDSTTAWAELAASGTSIPIRAITMSGVSNDVRIYDVGNLSNNTALSSFGRYMRVYANSGLAAWRRIAISIGLSK